MPNQPPAQPHEHVGKVYQWRTFNFITIEALKSLSLEESKQPFRNSLIQGLLDVLEGRTFPANELRQRMAEHADAQYRDAEQLRAWRQEKGL